MRKANASRLGGENVPGVESGKFLAPHGIAKGDIYVGEVGVTDWKTNFPDEEMPAVFRSTRCLQKLERVQGRAVALSRPRTWEATQCSLSDGGRVGRRESGEQDTFRSRLAPHQAVAERGLQGISDRTAACRVQAGRAGLTDSFASARKNPFMKAGCGKRLVCAADGGRRKEQSNEPPPTRQRGSGCNGRREGGSSTMNRADWQREEPEAQRKAEAFNR
jgi:hypothetical protein